MKHLNFAHGSALGLEGISMEAIETIEAAKKFHATLSGKAPTDVKSVEDAGGVSLRLKGVLQKIRSHLEKSDFNQTKPMNVGKLVKICGAHNAKNPAQLISHLKNFNGNVGSVVTEIANVGKAVKAGKMSAEQAHKVANEDQHKLLDKAHQEPHPVVAMVFTKKDLLALLDVAIAAGDKTAQHKNEVEATGKQSASVATEDFGESVGKALLWVFKIAIKIFLIWVMIQVVITMIFLALPSFGVAVILGMYVMKWLIAVFKGVDLGDEDGMWNQDKYDDSFSAKR